MRLTVGAIISEMQARDHHSKRFGNYLTAREVIAILRISKNTLREILPDIPGCVRLGERGLRIPEKGLEAWLQKMRATETQQIEGK